VLTRYNPPEPLLIAGMNAGDSKTLMMKVNVYDLSNPKDFEHKGSLDVTLSYVGAYRVTVPAGTFDAALLKWDFKGKIGPASVEDIQARFVVPDVGMVAAAEKRDVAAFLIYNDNTKVGKVLAQKRGRRATLIGHDPRDRPKGAGALLDSARCSPSSAAIRAAPPSTISATYMRELADAGRLILPSAADLHKPLLRATERSPRYSFRRCWRKASRIGLPTAAILSPGLWAQSPGLWARPVSYPLDSGHTNQNIKFNKSQIALRPESNIPIHATL
jgi:hypothetical protein